MASHGSCIPEYLSSLQFHAVVGILLEDADPMVSVMKLEKAPDETYADIGGLDQQIQEIKVCTRLCFMSTFDTVITLLCSKHCIVELLLRVGLIALCGYSHIYVARMSPTLHRSSAIRCFERGDAIEIHDGIIFNFYTGLSHICTLYK